MVIVFTLILQAKYNSTLTASLNGTEGKHNTGLYDCWNNLTFIL